MEVNKFKVGPILGNTTCTAAHIFGRGKSITKKSNKKYSFGVYRIKEADGEWSAPIVRFQQPHFDFSSVGILNNLESSTVYEYQAGYVHSAEKQPDVNTFQWSEIPIIPFKTSSENSAENITFAFGSCRYLLKLFGGRFFDTRGDKAFRSINSDNVDQVLMLGDQIYADDLSFFAADDSLSEYLSRYRDAFSQPHFSKLVSRTPTYMTLDDHEIEDNWPAKASNKDMMIKYPAAMHAYKIYQMSHSPVATLNEDLTKIDDVGNKYWYTMSNGCSDFFMMDVRTQRIGNEKIIDDDQMSALLSWLSNNSGCIKFIATSVPFFPDYSKGNNDKWSGFIEQRNQILDFISDNEIKKVVFLSGDVHASMAAELTRSDNPNFHVISIVSSPFFWPYPHPKQDTFQMEGSLTGHDSIAVNQLMAVYCSENYGKVLATPNCLTVEMKGRKGNLKESKIIEFR